MARLDIVGTGLAPGQLSEAGVHALGQCRWLAHYGLPHAVRGALLARWPQAADLDAMLGASPAGGFVHRMGGLLAAAAAREGRIALAVSGHPVAANPATPCLRAALLARGIEVTLYSAPSALDQFMAATGVDLVACGVSLVDACRWLAGDADRAGQALAVWNVGYLGAPHLDLLEARLHARFGPHHPLHLFRAIDARPRIECWPLAPAAAWRSRLDAETTLFAF